MADGMVTDTIRGQFAQAQDEAFQGVIMFKSKRARTQAPNPFAFTAIAKALKIDPRVLFDRYLNW